MEKTISQYNEVITWAKDIFMKKAKDYGTAWRILRTTSLTDQIFIKANRIRSIEEKGVSKVEDPIDLEYIGIINYCIMALIQLELGSDEELEMPIDKVESLYDAKFQLAQKLMTEKNHDYGEAWRDMRVSSMTDLILMKILRIKQIEENDGKTIISEGLDANYTDMINYAVFALIKLEEEKVQL